MSKSDIDKKSLAVAYMYAAITQISIIVMFVVSLIYPVEFLNILGIENPIMKAIWQSLITVAPANFILKEYLKKHYKF